MNGKPISDLVPHAHDMVLLENVVSFDDSHVVTRTTTHQKTDNPLRFKGRLTAVSGAEYGAQAMAVHGGLLGHDSAGYLSALSNLAFHVTYLDEIGGALTVEAHKYMSDGHFMVYDFNICSDRGRLLVEGRGIVYLTSGALS